MDKQYTGIYFNNNPTKSYKQDESILQHIPEQNNIPVLFKPKIDNDDTSDKENVNSFSIYNLFYIKILPFNKEISKY